MQTPKKIVKVWQAEIKSIDEEKFTVTALVSSDSVDRDGEIVTPEAIGKRLDVYRAHPVLLSSHRYDKLMNQIGMAEEVKATPKGVTARFKYFVGQGNPEADWAFKLAQHGIAAYSIGFMAHGWEDKSIDGEIFRQFTDVELIEISQVLVPSNRDALLGRRSSECQVEKELVELAIAKCFGGEEKPEAKPEPTTEAEPKVEAPAAEPEPKVEIPEPEKPAVDPAVEIAEKLLADEGFIQKIAEKLSTKQQPKSADGEGYFKGVLDAAGGSPDAKSKETPDLRSLFSESADRHFKKQ